MIPGQSVIEYLTMKYVLKEEPITVIHGDKGSSIFVRNFYAIRPVLTLELLSN